MPVINPMLGLWNFRQKITRLVETGTANSETVLQTFHELADDYLSNVIGCVLVAADGRRIEAFASRDYDPPLMSEARFASERLCHLYSEACITATSTPLGPLQEVIFHFTDTYIGIIPLPVDDWCLVVLVNH